MADTITTKSGREYEIDRKQMRKMRNIAALTSNDVDRIMGAACRIVVGLSEEQAGEMDDAEFGEITSALGREYSVPKAS